MSFEFLKPLNNINISVKKNEALLWEYQAGAKSYSEATEKIKEEADQLEKELAGINEEIADIEPKIKILDSCYDVQMKSLALSQQSLINQRLYKKSLIEKNKNHEEQMNLIIEDYREYIAECKAKLRISNPTYNLLQTKIIEYEGSKIRIMDLKQKILELKRMEKMRIDIMRKLFYEDIIEFAQNMVNRRSHLQAMSWLKTAESKERECMQKMREALELLKQKQMWKIPQRIRNNFSRPLEEVAKYPKRSEWI